MQPLDFKEVVQLEAQCSLKFKSSAVHVVGSSVGQTEQSKFCRFTTAGWHSPQPQHFLARSGWAKGSTLQFLKSEIETWSILSDWLIFCCCKNPKADVETISQVSWEDRLVVPLVHCPSEVSQSECARWNTVDLCRYCGICCSPATIACFPTSLSLVAEMSMAGKATPVKWIIRVGEQPPATSRRVSRGFKQGGLTLAEELD